MVQSSSSCLHLVLRVKEKFKKLIEINENLGILDNLIGPTQTLIKEGRITKISARSGLPQERYIYLVCHMTFADQWGARIVSCDCC
jgi:hypothetical protein